MRKRRARSHCRTGSQATCEALEYYGAAPTIIVPDNPCVGVAHADRYEPELQRSYEELAARYQAVIIPSSGPSSWCAAGSSLDCVINASSAWTS